MCEKATETKPKEVKKPIIDDDPTPGGPDVD